MESITRSPAARSAVPEKIPPLQHGDRLTRVEFERRYGAMAHLKKAELIAEVAASSVSYDLGVKLDAYLRNGVREYVVWRVLESEIDWFILRGGAYERLSPDAARIYRSEVFPGLWLDVAAMLRGDIAAVLRTVQQGLASPEHAAFVSLLQASAAKE